MHHINRGPHKNRTAGVCVHVCVCMHIGALLLRERWCLAAFGPLMVFAAPPPLALFVCVIVCVSL